MIHPILCRHIHTSCTSDESMLKSLMTMLKFYRQLYWGKAFYYNHMVKIRTLSIDSKFSHIFHDSAVFYFLSAPPTTVWRAAPFSSWLSSETCWAFKWTNTNRVQYLETRFPPCFLNGLIYQSMRPESLRQNGFPLLRALANGIKVLWSNAFRLREEREGELGRLK